MRNRRPIVVFAAAWILATALSAPAMALRSIDEDNGNRSFRSWVQEVFGKVRCTITNQCE